MAIELTQRKGRALAAMALAVAIGLVAGAVALVSSAQVEKASATPPSGVEGVEYAADEYGFPEVDWAAWAEINPDVIGWITVPGTTIDYPVVQAPADDPNFYLDHDAYGKSNSAGAVYLDADCIEKGIDSPNAVICAHHIKRAENAMFAPLAEYKDGEYASSHATVLIQTPEGKAVYQVVAADVIAGADGGKVTSFEDAAALREWLSDTAASSDVAVTRPSESAENALTLVTCSYNYSKDERTIVYAQREETLR